MMKRMLLPLTLALLLLLTACGGTNDADNGELSGIANPWTDCETLDEAVALAKFDITLPDDIKGFNVAVYRVMPEQMLEIIYQSGNAELRIRKAPTKGNGEDISGDYNTYSDTFPLDSVNATIRGNDDTASLATWTDGEYSYAVTADPGIDVGTMQAIVAATK
ncbi:MAG: hypothetical protein KBS74_05565 [Clostridiales bacterium]|nr:hypothetical protein [Candidatus Cacconaster stercorequi]